MSYKILLTADWHLSNKLPHSLIQENGVSDRFTDQLNVCEKIFLIAEQEGVKKIFILGDLFDRSLVDPVTLIYANNILTTHDEIPIYILSGNHDTNAKNGGRFLVEAFNHISARHIRAIDSRTTKLSIVSAEKDANIYFFSYCQTEELRHKIKKISKSLNVAQFNIALIHASVMGARIGDWNCSDGIKPSVLKRFNRVYAGHFHDAQNFSKNGMYVGAPMQHDFSDSGSVRGCWIVDIGRSEKFIQIKSPKFHIVRLNVDNLKNTKIPKMKHDDYVRLEVVCSHSDWSKAKRSIVELKESLSGDGLRASYVHKPIYHHHHRLKGDSVERYSLDEAIESYVNSPAVIDNQLDKSRLVALGKETLQRAMEKQ